MKENKPVVALIRGAYAHSCELQNYVPLSEKFSITVFTSKNPLQDGLPITSVQLSSLTDSILPHSLLKPIANRTLGDMHFLFGLEDKLIRADIIHTADPYYYYSYQAALVKSRHPQKKLISTYWETIPFRNESTSQKRKLKRFVMSLVDHFVVHSQKSMEALIAEGISPKRISLIRLGVSLTHFKPVVKNPSTILFVGRLVPEKNPLAVLYAFSEIHKMYPHYRLRFIGDGPLRNKILIGSKRLNLQQYISVNSYEYINMYKIYVKASICIFPSRNTTTWEEQYGMVIVEALASGIPIITTDCGAIPEIAGNTALFTPQNSQIELNNALKILLANPKQAQKRGTMGRKRAEKYFDVKNSAQELLNVYETTLGDNFDQKRGKKHNKGNN